MVERGFVSVECMRVRGKKGRERDASCPFRFERDESLSPLRSGSEGGECYELILEKKKRDPGRKRELRR